MKPWVVATVSNRSTVIIPPSLMVDALPAVVSENTCSPNVSISVDILNNAEVPLTSMPGTMRPPLGNSVTVIEISKRPFVNLSQNQYCS